MERVFPNHLKWLAVAGLTASMIVFAIAPIVLTRSSITHAVSGLDRSSAITRKIIGPNAQPLLGSGGVEFTPNWSGYELSGQTYTAATSTWVVPTVSYFSYAGSPSPEVMSTWVGIGGVEPDRTLIQLGTEQKVFSSGQVGYRAWYELIPGGPQYYDQISPQYIVSPGDTVTASLQCAAPCIPNQTQAWQLSFHNLTKNWSHTLNVSYPSSLATAEWIVEAECLSNCLSTTDAMYSYLPSFTQVNFSNATVNGAPAGLQLSNGLVMNDPFGNAHGYPFPPCGGNVFAVNFVQPQQQPPPPPKLVLESNAPINVSGPAGGPFSPSSLTYLIHASSDCVDFAVVTANSNSPPPPGGWPPLNISPERGTVSVTPSQPITITVDDTVANGLGVGTYGPAPIGFIDPATNEGNAVTATLTVYPRPIPPPPPSLSFKFLPLPNTPPHAGVGQPPPNDLTYDSVTGISSDGSAIIGNGESANDSAAVR